MNRTYINLVDITATIRTSGIDSGQPTILIQLGSNLTTPINTVWIRDIAEYCKYIQIFRTIYSVTIAGDEPLAQPGTIELIKLLSDLGFIITIETYGTSNLDEINSLRNDHGYEDIQVMVNYKSSVSEKDKAQIKEVVKQLSFRDGIKFAVETSEDLEEMQQLYKEWSGQTCSFFVTSTFKMLKLRDIVDYVLKHKLNRCTMQLKINEYMQRSN